MTAITLVTIDSDDVTVSRGALHNCPAELLTKAQIEAYRRMSPGWAKCPLGYHALTRYDELGRKIIVPGIIVEGERAPKRKFPDYKIKFTKNQIEEFLEPHLAFSVSVKEARDREYANLTHDLRAISTELYHAAIAAQQHLRDQEYGGVDGKLETVKAAQQMMSIRLDIIDYNRGVASEQTPEDIRFFPKIDKVQKCLKGQAAGRSIKCTMTGTAYGKIHGPPIFELVPFVILENAIKYSPSKGTIQIRINEEEEKEVLRIESFGPRIKDEEKEKIFNKGFRGDAADATQQAGSGIGLYAAKRLIEDNFGGEIFVYQGKSPVNMDSQDYWFTRFTIVVPRVK